MRTRSGVLVDVEIFVNALFDYQVHTEAVFERGIVDIGNYKDAYVRFAGAGAAKLPRIRVTFRDRL